MMAPSNPTPLVIFALIAMTVCGLFGIMLGQDPFGPGQEVKAEQARTQLALQVHSTELARGVLETPQAISIQHTLEAARWTAMPGQLTATQVARLVEIEVAQIQATQTAIAGEALNRQLAIQATQTALARSEQMEAVAVGSTSTAIVEAQAQAQANRRLSSSAAVLGALVLCGWIIARIVVQVMQARGQEKTAQAQFLAEQCRMASLRASLKKEDGNKSRARVPGSLLNKTGDIDKLPRAE